MKKEQYIILAGTDKSGTTAIFKYLEEHPSICGSFIKQTYYFHDDNVTSTKSSYRFEKDKPAYHHFFRDCKETAVYKMESAPSYMYSAGSAKRIKEYLKDADVKILFVLREPVSRFNSWYNYDKQIGLIDEQMTFEEYFTKNINNQSDEKCYNRLEFGLYSKYMQAYFDLFGKENVLVYYYENLKTDASGFMQQMSSDLNIEPSFYENYEFKYFNKTVKYKNQKVSNLFLSLRQFAVKYIYKNKILSALFYIPKKILIALHRRNATDVKKQGTNTNIEQQLNNYYKNERQLIANLIDSPSPWLKETAKV